MSFQDENSYDYSSLDVDYPSDIELEIDDENILSPMCKKELYFLKRYRSRIQYDIIHENDESMKEYLRDELEGINSVIYNLCYHSFVEDEFEIGINKLQTVHYCIHCEMEMKNENHQT